jgi:hypothetical protein
VIDRARSIASPNLFGVITPQAEWVSFSMLTLTCNQPDRACQTFHASFGMDSVLAHLDGFHAPAGYWG